MKISDKQRNVIFLVVFVFILYRIAPWAVSTSRRMLGETPSPIAKPSPLQLPEPMPKPLIVANPEDALNAQTAKLQGDWLGSGLLDGGPCRLNLQIHTDPLNPGGYSAYSTVACNPTLMAMGLSRDEAMKKIVIGATPTSTIMSGAPHRGDLVFKTDKAIGTPMDGCPWTSLTVSPFGEQIAAEWQAPPCTGGQMMLHRVTNLN